MAGPWWDPCGVDLRGWWEQSWGWSPAGGQPCTRLAGVWGTPKGWVPKPRRRVRQPTQAWGVLGTEEPGEEAGYQDDGEEGSVGELSLQVLSFPRTWRRSGRLCKPGRSAWSRSWTAWWLSGWSTPMTRSMGAPLHSHLLNVVFAPPETPPPQQTQICWVQWAVGGAGRFFPLLTWCPTGASSPASAETGRCMTTSNMSGCRGGR